MRRPIVGVIGSGSELHEQLAIPLGRWLAQQGVHLLTGGGQGTMASVSRAFFEVEGRTGSVLGVLPAPQAQRSGYPNPWIEIPIRTHLPLSGAEGTDPRSRNHIVVLSADLLVALPGSAGTASEVQLALTYKRPIIAFLSKPREAERIPPEVTRAFTLESVCDFVTAELQRIASELG